MKLSKTISVLSAVLLSTVIFAAPVLADAILTTPELPPSGPDPLLGYLGQLPTLFPGGVDIYNPFHSQFINIIRTPVGPDEIENFDSTLTAMVDAGGPSLVTLTGPVTTIVYGKIGNTTGTFDTEIIAMSLTGDVGGIPIQIRESPSLGSLGQTTITDLGGGLWLIDSFFDVYTELSLDGGPFQPQIGNPSRMELVRLPEPATLGLLLIGALAILRRPFR